MSLLSSYLNRRKIKQNYAHKNKKTIFNSYFINYNAIYMYVILAKPVYHQIYLYFSGLKSVLELPFNQKKECTLYKNYSKIRFLLFAICLSIHLFFLSNFAVGLATL